MPDRSRRFECTSQEAFRTAVRGTGHNASRGLACTLAEIGADRPEIQKLAAFAKNHREIRWTRIYQIPANVMFSHKSHLAVGSTCRECHGQVADRDQLYLEGDISMGACINCHKAKEASVDCTYCHEQQAASLLK